MTVVGDVVGNFVFDNVSVGPCPNCGGIGTIRNGTYEIVGSAIRTIIGATQTPADLNRLRGILQNAQRNRTEPATVAEQLEEQAPELSAFASWVRQYLVPKNAGEVSGLISMILAAVAMVLQVLAMSQPSQQFDAKAVETIVEKAVSAALAQTAEKKSGAVSRNPHTKKSKTGRNEVCPCGSGKKFKMCCIKRPTQAHR